MPSTAESPAVRAERLEKTALPKAKKLARKRLQSKDMTEIVGVSWPTLRKWTREIEGFEQSGAFEGGAEGIPYSFKPVATVRFLIKHFKNEAQQRSARQRTINEAIGGQELEGADPEWSLADLDKAINVARKLREEQEARKQLVDIDKAKDAFDQAILVMQQAGVTAASKQDPMNLWPPEIRESFDKAMSDVLMTMNKAGKECLRKLGGSTS